MNRKSESRLDHDFSAVHAGYELARGKDIATVGTAGEITVTFRLVFMLITVFPAEAAHEKPFGKRYAPLIFEIHR